MSAAGRALAGLSAVALVVCSVLFFAKSAQNPDLPAQLKSGQEFLGTVHRIVHIAMGVVVMLSALLALVSALLGKKREEAGSITALVGGFLGLIAVGIYAYLMLVFRGNPLNHAAVTAGIALVLLLAGGGLRMYVVVTTPGN